MGGCWREKETCQSVIQVLTGRGNWFQFFSRIFFILCYVIQLGWGVATPFLPCNKLAPFTQAISWPKFPWQPSSVMSDGIVFLPPVFLAALWFGRPPLTISTTTISSSSHHRAVYSRLALWTPAHVGIIYPLSLRCPICQLTDKPQTFLTHQFWCRQLCFIRSQIPCRVKRSLRQSPNGQMNSAKILEYHLR